jgi:acyl carrier protein
MNRIELFDIISKIIVKAKPSVQINENSLFKEDFGFDSLDTINFFFELENQTSLEISEKDIDGENLVSVGSVLNYLEKK